jgi:hypothetical protein
MPQPAYPQGRNPVSTYEGDQISVVRWMGVGETRSAYRIFVAKLWMALVRRLSRKSEDSISVFSKLVWSVAGCCGLGFTKREDFMTS